MNKYQKKERQAVWKYIEENDLSEYDYCKARNKVRRLNKLSRHIDKVLLGKLNLYDYQRAILNKGKPYWYIDDFYYVETEYVEI